MTLDKRVFALAPLAAAVFSSDTAPQLTYGTPTDAPRHETIARGDSIEIIDILKGIDTSEDGTGTYQLASPVSFVQHSSLEKTWNNSRPDVSETTNERSFYQATDAPEFYRSHVESVGYSPVDAIEALITSATEAAHVDASKSLHNENGSETRRVGEQIRVTSYASGVDLGTITVDALMMDGKPIGYRAWANATVYGRGE